MKTAEEILFNAHKSYPNGDEATMQTFENMYGFNREDIIKAMKAYAEQWLRVAAERAKVIGTHATVPEGQSTKVAYPHTDGWEVKVDQQSILSLIEEIKKP